MEIIDINEKYTGKYCMCLEDWSDDIKEAGNHKEIWYHKMKHKGLRVKLAIEHDETFGMIQYFPIEHSSAEGTDAYFIACIWVHGHKAGVGNQQKRGIGQSLLKAAEEDVRSRDCQGIAAWGISLPIWMKASWFKKQGYKKVDKNGMAVLLWKPFKDNALPPRWIREKKKPLRTAEKVTVTSFINGWCPVQNLIYERAKRASAEIGDHVVFQEIHTFDRNVFLEWGISDALFIDGKQVRTGPPPTYQKIKRKIARKVKKI